MSAAIVHVIFVIRFAIVFFIGNSVCFCSRKDRIPQIAFRIFTAVLKRECYSGLTKSSMHEMSFDKRHSRKPLRVADVLAVAALNATIVGSSDCIA
jgi:hypothetical protein